MLNAWPPHSITTIPQPTPSTQPSATLTKYLLDGLCHATTLVLSVRLPAGPPLLKKRAAALASEKCSFRIPELPLCGWCPPPASLGRRGPTSKAPPPASGLASDFLRPQPGTLCPGNIRHGADVASVGRARMIHRWLLVQVVHERNEQ